MAAPEGLRAAFYGIQPNSITFSTTDAVPTFQLITTPLLSWHHIHNLHWWRGTTMSLLLHLVAAALLIAHLGDAQDPAAQALPGPGTNSSSNANVSVASAGPDTAFRLLPEHNLVDGSVTSLPPASGDGEPPVSGDGEPPERPVLFERPLVDGERGFSRGRTEGFSPRQGPPLRTCHRPAQCRPLRRAECFGTSLGYTSTSLNLTGLTSQQSVKVSLQLWYPV